MTIKLCVDGREVISDNTLLRKLKDVDGQGSGVDADYIDGRSAEEFVLIETIGDVSALKTGARYSVVAAINENFVTAVDNKLDYISRINTLEADVTSLIEATVTNRINSLEASVNDQFIQSDGRLISHANTNSSLTDKGHVMLSNALDSTSEKIAITSKAGKILNDKIDANSALIANTKNELLTEISNNTSVTVDSDSINMIGTKESDSEAWSGVSTFANAVNNTVEVARAKVTTLRYNNFGAMIRLKVSNRTFGSNIIKLSIMKKSGELFTTVASRTLSDANFKSDNKYQSVHLPFEYAAPKATNNEFYVKIETLATLKPVKVSVDYIAVYPISLGVFADIGGV